MLKDFAAVATLAVKDADRAKAFYRDTLGFELTKEGMGVLTFTTGGAQLFVYQSQFAGTNQATGANFVVDNVAGIAADLKARGVSFEHYGDMPDMTLQGDVYVGEAMSVAWFKDPDGNILSLVSDD